MTTVIIADDASFMRNSLKYLVEMAGHQVVGLAKDGQEAVRLYNEHKPDLVLLDILMEHTDGLAALKQIIQMNAQARVIMVTALGDEAMRKQAERLGACGYIQKPFSQDAIIQRERVAWAGDLRAAVGRNELELYYRPQAKLTTGEIIGIEAEIRWHHPMRDLLSPAEFLLNLDSDGILIEVGDWLLDRACRQLSEWHRAGIATPVLAVTAWLTQLRNQREFVETVVQTLTRWALKPADLELDVTEATLVHLTITQNSVLDRLQRLGVQVAITDFGTQFSSLDYLTTYRVSL